MASLNSSNLTDPSTSTASGSSASSLPPEALAFASRLYDAARQGQLPIFEQALAAGLPPNMTNDKGDTLLMLSSYHGHAPLVSLLLQHGADPNRLNDKQQSPLAGAVYKNEMAVMEALLAGSADPTLGRPSAIEAAGVFGRADLVERFQRGMSNGIGHEEREEDGAVGAAVETT
ncbi:MAG: hypothetical protein MMC33_007615 [Icmadophila ericetorum]|nr:hypothetical protein [Icmadophila ericetorum]